LPRTPKEIAEAIAAASVSLSGHDELVETLTHDEYPHGVGAVPLVAAAPAAWPHKLIRPLTEAADGLIEYAQNPEGRFMLGLHDIDIMTRGFGRKELAYVTGKAHSGKTQVILQGVANNPDSRIVVFTPDETSELVLSKLVSITHGLDAEEVEARIRKGDPEAIRIVQKTAAVDYANLFIVDESLTLGSMMDAVHEAEDHWSEQVDAIIVDFLELIPSSDESADGVVAKSQALKRFTHDVDAPVICLHQASRSSGARGQAAGMGAMRYGGETEAIFVLEVFRKKDDESLDEWERKNHIDTVTVNLCKNKRPPCKKGQVDMFLDPQTGRVSRIEARDVPPVPVVEPVVVLDDWRRDQMEAF
jgi:replicative DNA helicase